VNEPLAEMLRYNRWATLRLLEACRHLSDAQLDAHMAGVSGSVRRLLLHMVGGQQTFALRTKGRQHEGELNGGSMWPGWDALAGIARVSADELVEIAEQLIEDETIVLPYMSKRPTFPKSFFLVHAVEHGVEHRTEIKVALAQQGVETPDLDGWSYAEARGFGAEA
jgi:uncharacterized damage-inducible protein DinB